MMPQMVTTSANHPVCMEFTTILSGPPTRRGNDLRTVIDNPPETFTFVHHITLYKILVEGLSLAVGSSGHSKAFPSTCRPSIVCCE